MKSLHICIPYTVCRSVNVTVAYLYTGDLYREYTSGSRSSIFTVVSLR